MISVEKQTLRVLKAARKLIANPKRWCQDAYGKTKEGHALSRQDVTSTACTQFCMEGAVVHAADGIVGADWRWGRGLLESVLPGKDKSLICYNDAKNRKHEQVLRVFDKAIGKAEKRVLAAKVKTEKARTK